VGNNAPAGLTLNADTGVVSGTVSGEMGLYEVKLQRGSTMHLFPLVVLDSSPAFQQADPDFDGWNSLSELLLGRDPALPGGSERIFQIADPSGLSLSWLAPAGIPAAHYIPELSLDLNLWQNGPGFIEIVSDSVVGDVRQVVVRPAANLAGHRRYLRLRFTP
jgi:hypothetical protein